MRPLQDETTLSRLARGDDIMSVLSAEQEPDRQVDARKEGHHSHRFK